MTTVGYGDIVPVSTAGSIVVSALVIFSVLYMAMPLGIVGQAFNQVWNDRDRLLLVLRTKERLLQWGYTAKDALEVFRWFDEDGSGQLDIDEFRSMIDQMRLGFDRKRVVQLFNGIDKDGGGTIEAEEFVKYLFPEDYYDIYGVNEDDSSSGSDGDDGDDNNDIKLGTLIQTIDPANGEHPLSRNGVEDDLKPPPKKHGPPGALH